MSQIAYVSKSDRLPSLQIRCYDANGLVDFGTATAVFFMEDETGVTKVSGSAATVLSGGRLRYSWGSSDTNTAGLYRAWFVVTYNSLQWTFPNRKGELLVKIAETS